MTISAVPGVMGLSSSSGPRHTLTAAGKSGGILRDVPGFDEVERLRAALPEGAASADALDQRPEQTDRVGADRPRDADELDHVEPTLSPRCRQFMQISRAIDGVCAAGRRRLQESP